MEESLAMNKFDNIGNKIITRKQLTLLAEIDRGNTEVSAVEASPDGNYVILSLFKENGSFLGVYERMADDTLRFSRKVMFDEPGTYLRIFYFFSLKKFNIFFTIYFKNLY